MGKRIILAVFGGIAVLGLALAIVGFAMGGRPGSIRAEDGSIVYRTSNDAVTLGTAPGWMRNGDNFGPIFSWRGPKDDHSVIEDRPGAASNSTSAPPRTGGGAAANLGFNVADVKKLDIDISAGYVEVLTGDNPGLVVDGDMDYDTWFDGGTWHLEAKIKGIIKGWSDLWSRDGFWWNGSDITTTFILTLPKGTQLSELELDLDMGKACVDGISAQDLDVATDMGAIIVQEVSATDASLDVNMGSINTSDFTVENTCELDCDMGDITMFGKVGNKLNAECDMGTIMISLHNKPVHYTVDHEVGLGTIKVNGQNYGSGKHDNGELTKPVDLHMELKCGLGTIKVSIDQP